MLDEGLLPSHLRRSVLISARTYQETMMQDDARELPAARGDQFSRFLGGSPLAVLLRLVLMSVLVGVVLAAIGLDPWNIVASIRRLADWIWNLGFDALNGLWRYFILGAVIVIPLWLLSRLFSAGSAR
jgi:hypothetical protein